MQSNDIVRQYRPEISPEMRCQPRIAALTLRLTAGENLRAVKARSRESLSDSFIHGILEAGVKYEHIY